MTIANGTIITGHKIIVDPENPAEVCGVLGTNDADIGWVCTRATLINKWAKYKPVKNAEKNYQSQLKADNTWKSESELPSGTNPWWKASNGKCGLNITPRTTGSALVTNWNNEWVYDAITINSSNVASHWCRLTDYNYYDHNASVPVYIAYPTQYQINQQQTLDIVFQEYNGNNYQLMLTDFTEGVWNSSAAMYCGVLIVWGTPNIAYANKQKVSVVNATPLGTDLASYGKYTRVVSVPSANLPQATPNEITIYPFLCQNAYSTEQKGAEQDIAWENGVIACPFEPVTIMAVMGNITGVISGVTCTYGINSVQLAFTYTITGHGGGFSKNGLTAWIYVLDNDTDTSGQYPEYSKKNGRHIISYGTATNNPYPGNYFSSVTVSDNASISYTQNTLTNVSSGNLTVGIDTVSYVEQYRAKHGSGAAKITLIIEFDDNSNGIYGQAPLSDITIEGSY